MSSQSCPTIDEIESFASTGGAGPELPEHLRSCAKCRDLLESVRSNLALISRLRNDGPSAGGPLSPTDTLVPGYERLEELHRGGQGVVYRAIQKATHREVAIKLLLGGELATSSQRRRFEREVELAASLQHPSIVTVHDGGTTPDGRLFCCMELVHGRTLADFARSLRNEGAHDAAAQRRLLRVFEQACAAVAFAHQRGVIHRDLKPANILVNDCDVPIVVDFGLAKSVAEDRGDGVTRTGEFAGSLAYASPEHLTGRVEDVEVRSDVYSLGVILYEILTGRTPYPVDGRMDQLVRDIAEREPAPLARRRSASTSPWRIDADLEAIVLKALEKDRARRYQSAGGLADDLRRHIAGEPIEARKSSFWRMLRKVAVRHRTETAAACILLVAIVGFGVTMAIQAGVIATQRSSALAAEAAARSEAETARYVSTFLVSMFKRLDPTSTGRSIYDARGLLDDATERMAELEDRPALRAAVAEAVGGAYLNLGALDAAAPLLQSSLTELERLHGARSPKVASALLKLGGLRQAQGAYADAERHYGRAVEIRRLEPEAQEQLATALSAHAGALVELKRLDEAAALLRESIALQRGESSADRESLAYTINNLAWTLHNQSDIAGAEPLYLEAIAMRRRVHPPDHPLIALSLDNYAGLMLRAERYDDAVAAYTQSLALRQRRLGPAHPDVANSHHWLGQSLRRAGRLSAGETHLQAALEIRRAALPAEHPDTCRTLIDLGVVLVEEGCADAGVALLREAVERVQRPAPVRAAFLPLARQSLVDGLLACGETEEAEREIGDLARLLKRGELDVSPTWLAQVLMKLEAARGPSPPE